jgi:CRP/FNR family transcriptional regulator
MNKLQITSECFKSLSNEELELLHNKKAQITYLKGENIIKQGAFSSHVLFVISGLARIYLQTSPSKQVNLQLAKQGDFISFGSVFNEDTYSYSAIALKDTVICMVDKEALKKLLLNNPMFGMQITARNAKIESRYLNIINNISYKQMRGKLASALLYLLSIEKQGENVFSFLSRQDIADFASITIESAIKFLKEFEKDKLLQLVGKDIIVQKETELETISKTG